MSNTILDKPLFSMTGAEIIELFSLIMAIEHKPTVQDFTNEKHVYGLDGLARLLGCGKTTAQKIKNTHVLDDAIIQHGKKLIINADLALKLLKEKS